MGRIASAVDADAFPMEAISRPASKSPIAIACREKEKEREEDR